MATTALVVAPEVGAQEFFYDPLWAVITDISGDGRTFVGQGPDGGILANYFGTIDGSRLRLPGVAGRGYVDAISGDGRVAVGDYQISGGYSRAWRYADGVVTELGSLAPGVPTAQSAARDVSDDGSRVVGYSTWQGNERAFVWVEGATGGVEGNEQMYALRAIAGGNNRTGAYAISGDGRYAGGYSDGDGYTRTAVRWDLDDLEDGAGPVPHNLGSLSAGSQSTALALSGDGSMAVGWAYDADGRMRAFRWLEGASDGVIDNVEMKDIGDLGGQTSVATAVTRDGTWVIGQSETEEGIDLGFRWSEATGMESIADWLARQGVDTEGFVLEIANGISDDGNVVVGRMVAEEGGAYGYLARADSEHGGGLMNIEEYNRTLYAAAGGVASTGEFLTWLPMNGAHHRPMMMTPSLSGDMCAWATGDFAHHDSSNTGMALAEIGACTDLAGGSVRIGGAVGTSRSWQDLSLGGSSRMQGAYVLGEADWQPDGAPLLLSVTGMLGSWDANIERAYSNGASTAVSSGSTNVTSGVVRVRADWLEAATVGSTTINPWMSLSLGAVHVDGYSEDGGPFPATFDAQRLAHMDLRVGVTAVTELSAATTLSTTFEVAHRRGHAPEASGQVDGLFDFALGGGPSAQTWIRAGAELDHAIDENLAVSGSVHLASNGRDPSVAISAGIKGSF
jgi:probable HAF family extracellular repeat protein